MGVCSEILGHQLTYDALNIKIKYILSATVDLTGQIVAKWQKSKVGFLEFKVELVQCWFYSRFLVIL